MLKGNKFPKILVVGPHLASQGGVAGYYSFILPLLQESEKLQIIYLPIGLQNKGKLKSLKMLLNDLRRFNNLVKTNKPDLVFFNPAFELKNFIREGIMFLIARRNKAKTIVFFRGWIQKFIQRYYLWASFFNLTFRKADAFIELAEHQRTQLKEWGVKSPIYLETTAVDMNLLHDFSLEKKLQLYQDKKDVSILFLARVEKAKGIFELLEAFRGIKLKYPNVRLTIAGDGGAMQEVRDYISEYRISDIILTGFVRGEAKSELFKTHHIYCLPSYSEGMPNSVLEAMAFAMPVVTTPVGGLKDFFEVDKMGYFAEIKSSSTLLTHLTHLIERQDLMLEMAEYNHGFSKERFMSDKVADRITQIILKTLQS